MTEKASQNCHTCRRRRVKCDRTLPECQKCATTNIECLGYGRLLLWNRGVATRGKMMGKTFDEANRAKEAQECFSFATRSESAGVCMSSHHSQHPRPLETNSVLDTSLIDPLLKDLDPKSRRYVSYFASQFCQEIVLYPDAERNVFRPLLQCIGTYPMLRDMIIGISAYSLFHHFTPEMERATLYDDALAAKHRALGTLRTALQNVSMGNVNVMLASVLLFIYFELMDSGQNTWKAHVEGAKMLVYHLQRQAVSGHGIGPAVATLANSWLISECIVLDVIGLTTSNSRSSASLLYEIEGFELGSFLELAEINHFASFPAPLLRLIFDVSKIERSERSTWGDGTGRNPAAMMIKIAMKFNPLAWAQNIQLLSPGHDVEQRTLIASAHKAATCLYIWRTFRHDLSDEFTEMERESLVSEIITRLAAIDIGNHLFKAIVWPCFIAGAETDDTQNRGWILERLQQYHALIPWNCVANCIAVLESIWSKKALEAAQSCESGLDWVQEIKRTGIDHFIA